MRFVVLQHIGSSQTRDCTGVPCIARWILNLWTTREAPKLVNFLYSHFNIEDGRKKTLWYIMLYYFKKGKNASEVQKKICAVNEEGAVTMDCVKSGL